MTAQVLEKRFSALVAVVAEPKDAHGARALRLDMPPHCWIDGLDLDLEGKLAGLCVSWALRGVADGTRSAPIPRQGGSTASLAQARHASDIAGPPSDHRPAHRFSPSLSDARSASPCLDAWRRARQVVSGTSAVQPTWLHMT